jgi:hypothetical protein
MAKKNDAPAPTIVAYKGFDENMKCRGYQYEVGKSYEHKGEVAACSGGFHACEYPLHVLQYYKPGTSRFAIVEQSGELSRHGDDTKVASSKITVKAEINLAGLIKASIDYTTSRAKPATGSSSKAKNGSAVNSGDSGAATASGDSGAATASGDYGAATASGYSGKVLGKEGCALFLVERNTSNAIVAVWAGISGRDGIKPDTWYRLKDGKPVEFN